ncbi:hypothetical protein LSAT2_007593 [Lamellibrachia satsuma]|nr:hypothetical protein LSAT2_007593 [Lamellibrachia satsuma]
MRNLPVMRDFSKLGAKKYTFFAPSNIAFENIPSHVSQHFQQANAAVSKERDDIMRYQTVLGVVKTDKMLKNEMLHSYGPDSNLFIFVVNGDHFVNGAKVLVPDIVASNGVVHVIDSLMYERGKSVNAYSYITETGTQLTNPSERTTRSFKELFDQYIEYEIAQHGGDYNARDELNGGHPVDGKILPVTVFVPSDEAIAKIPQQQLSLLKADSVELKKVIEGHLILGAAFHTNILLRPKFRDIAAMSGRIAVKKFLGNVYASNTCAQGMVTHGNITVKNGVVHIVDDLLGYVYSDAITQLHDQTQYQWFYSHVSGITDIVRMLTLLRGTTTVPDNMMYTVFAPVGVRGVDLTQHPNELDKAMRMHLIKGRVEVSDMKNNTRHETVNREQTATFYLVDDGKFHFDHLPGQSLPTGQPSSLQFPLSWTLLATVLQVIPAAFSSLCIELSLSLCSRSSQQPLVPSVLDSPCHSAPGQLSSLQFPLSWTLLVTVLQGSPAAFSSLCLGLSLSLCSRAAQQPSVPYVLVSPCHCAPDQPSSLQFPLSRAVLAAVPHVSPAAISSLCLGLSLLLCPMSAQQPPVPSALCFPCCCVPCQPSSHQFPLPCAFLVALSHVSQAATSSLCLVLSLLLGPMSAKQPQVPYALCSPYRCAPGQPSSLQFPMSWSLLATVPQISPAAFNSLCLGLSLLLCPMSAQQPSVLSALGSPCCCAPCQPSSHQFPLPWAPLAAVPHVSQAAASSFCLGLSLLLCPMSATQPPDPSALCSPCCWVPSVYVEVNYVRAKITQSDICVKNGILHNIDTVLGVPVHTIANAISDNEKELLQLRKVVRNTGLWTYLNDKTKLVTMFAPVDKAFQRMQDDSIGRKLLNPQHERNLQKMLQRHIIVEEVFLDTITDTKTFKTNLGDDIDIVKVGTEYRIRFGSKDIGVIRANMRMMNGVLHLIDGVIYSDDPSAAEWTSTAPVTSQCSLLLATVLLYHIFSRMSWTPLYL